MSDTVLNVRGGRPLEGEITVRAAKNFISKAMVASLLGEEPSTLLSVPEIRDVDVVSGLLKIHGVKVDHDRVEGVLRLDPSNIEAAHVVDIDTHAGFSRIPILFCGPLLHRLGHAIIPDLGGCRIGDRPINYHLDVLRQFGTAVKKRKHGIYITAPKGIRGAKVALDYPSVGATEQVLLTAVRVNGTTELSNAAIEPEIKDLIAVLQKMGAIISVGTDRVITIQGVDRLGGAVHRGRPDRIETGSWVCAALTTRGNIYVRNAKQQDMMSFLNTFRRAGDGLDFDADSIRFYHPGSDLQPIALETAVHPGFMTDWQQPLVVTMTEANGVSIVHETVYENRLGFTGALNDMGAKIRVRKDCLGRTPCRFGARIFNRSAVVVGPIILSGAEIDVPDLRGGFSHLVAALAADRVSRIHGVDLIDREYERFREKLSDLGADVWQDQPALKGPS